MAMLCIFLFLITQHYQLEQSPNLLQHQRLPQTTLHGTWERGERDLGVGQRVEQQMKLPSLMAVYLLLCGMVPYKLQTTFCARLSWGTPELEQSLF